MAQNVRPIHILTGDLSANSSTTFPAVITAAANDVTGAGANNVLCFTASANGGFVQRLRFKPIGTNVASMIRIFINNGATNATSTNNVMWDEIPLPATTISTTSQMTPIDFPMGILLPPSFKIYAGLTIAVAGGWQVIPVAGEY